MTKLAQLWDLIVTSSFREDIKDDYNNKEDNNKNDTYDKVDNKDYKYDKDSSALGHDRDI